MFVVAEVRCVTSDLECFQLALQLFGVDFTVLSELTLLGGFGTRILQLRLQLSHTKKPQQDQELTLVIV